jgi:hypothetical protein
MRLWAPSPSDVHDVILQLITKRRRRPVPPHEMARQLGTDFPAMSAAWRDGFPRSRNCSAVPVDAVRDDMTADDH